MKWDFKVEIAIVGFVLLSSSIWSREGKGISGQRTTAQEQQDFRLSAACSPASAKADLDINNVRTTIYNGGDMWWDLSALPRYEIPKQSRVHSSYAGSLWIGGLDAGGQLKVAAQTYRQSGNDFWPGPLNTTNASIESDACEEYDRIWKITRKEVEDFIADPTTITPTIREWPGNGNPARNEAEFLAPFVDIDGDNRYNPYNGDYPGYDFSSSGSCDKFRIFGDQTLWWVFNDKGNIHTQTGANPIGLEIHAQAFAFATNDELNNMTFYSYKVINRGNITLNQTYFGQWADSDLGYALDDYVGCDVGRGLGYTYNGQQNDGGSPSPNLGAYGANPPAFGLDFFEGPIADQGDGLDNDRDQLVDEPGEQIIMSKFMYYNNDGSVTGEPGNATHYYNYLRGFWKDGTPVSYGANGYGGSQTSNFMFPGNTDPDFPNQVWDEISAGNTPNDRRMLQSAGSFTLEPGAVNYVTVGAVWARTNTGGPSASVRLLKTADDKAQGLFNNCFRTLDGPRAPDLTIQELDREIIIYLSNPPGSNNENENYEGVDPAITYDNQVNISLDKTYNFEGYQIFQLRDQTVTTADLYNVDRARIVAQSDVRNGIQQLVNYVYDDVVGMDIPKDMTIQSADNGIQHSFNITEDAFASGDRRMVNHKTYYYMVLAYAYNKYIEYAPESFDSLTPLRPSNIGQKRPYLAGRQNVVVYSAVPHITSPELGGTNQIAQYGSGVKITRIEGCGNGNNVLDLTPESVDAILASPTVNNGGTSRLDHLVYEQSRGPVNIKVIDPLNVPEGEFELRIINNPNDSITVSPLSKWKLTQTSPESRTWTSNRAISLVSQSTNEQLIPELGLSITMSQVQSIGFNANPDGNGYLESDLVFAQPTSRWLSGVRDTDNPNSTNWIRSGSSVGIGSYSTTSPNYNPCKKHEDDENIDTAGNSSVFAPFFLDRDQYFEKMIDGTWAPYRLAAYAPSPNQPVCYNSVGPAYEHTSFITQQNKLSMLSNVDIVFTNDRSKWTRVPVFESGPNKQLNEGLREAFFLRNAPSVDKWGRSLNNGGDPTTANLISATGMSWFPGYAINIETGERLNMAFAENSALVADKGRDMLWNPTAINRTNLGEFIWGGMHYVYIFGHNGNDRYPSSHPSLANKPRDIPAYDEGRSIMDIMLSSVAAIERQQVFIDAMWTSIPILDESYNNYTFNYASSPLPCDAKVRLRVAKSYRRFYNGIKFNTSATDSAGPAVQQPVLNANNPLYTFDTYDVKVVTNDQASAVRALDLINIVPNPYYAFSGYEKNQLDTRVKITNLPQKCKIRIYTVNGTLVRTYTKDSPITSLDWDLKNQAAIPVASGLYIVHIDVPGVGEKILKWFGVLRPVDLDAY